MEATTMLIRDARTGRRLDVHPWYREAWFWFLVILPAVSVVLSFVTLYLALESMDAVVPHEGDSTSYSAPRLPEKTVR